MATDIAMIMTAIGIGLLVSSRASTWEIDPVLAIYGAPVAIGCLWFGFLALRGSYDQRIIGLGTEEVRRTVSATLYTFAIVAGVSYLFRADISRAYAFISLPLGLFLIVGGRFFWRGWLYRQRAKGRFLNPTIIVGSGEIAQEMAHRLQEQSYAGFSVVARYPAPATQAEAHAESLEAWVQGLGSLVDEVGAGAVAIAPSSSVSSDAIRELAWHLESRVIDLLIAPALLEVAGPRLSVRPAAGIPLIHLDEVALSKPQAFAKRTLDIGGSVIALLLLSPLLVFCASWVRVTSKGPVIFRQPRIGRGGKPFTMLKFRTMIDGADGMRSRLREQHELAEPLFKIKGDPRITRAGHFLRRWSLDELPQLLNVLGGSMSLVGPRPHPLDDVNRYEMEAFRRFALKPGMTGLWQVEGRSNLDWSEALELDLYYVETWSLSSDLVLLARTFRAVAQGRGAM